MMNKNCLHCNKNIIKPANESVRAFNVRRKFCSKTCQYASMKGLPVFDNTGKKLTEEHKKKISESHKGEKAYQWKGGINRSIKRRMKLYNSEGAHTKTEWEALKQKYNYMCLCCKQQEPFVKLCEDHIIPLIAGGSNYIENIQPLCRSCNSRKHVKTIDYSLDFHQITVA
jgi:5-methylcytosine-specific restriction endonuclease McrA